VKSHPDISFSEDELQRLVEESEIEREAKERKAEIKEACRFWIATIIALIALGIAIYSVYLQRISQKTEIKGQQKSQPQLAPSDSTKYP
jgi:hypothetical protein